MSRFATVCAVLALGTAGCNPPPRTPTGERLVWGTYIPLDYTHSINPPETDFSNIDENFDTVWLSAPEAWLAEVFRAENGSEAVLEELGVTFPGNAVLDLSSLPELKMLNTMTNHDLLYNHLNPLGGLPAWDISVEETIWEVIYQTANARIGFRERFMPNSGGVGGHSSDTVLFFRPEAAYLHYEPPFLVLGSVQFYPRLIYYPGPAWVALLVIALVGLAILALLLLALRRPLARITKPVLQLLFRHPTP